MVVVPVLVDGGIHRGTDVAKALCLRRTAVLIGRPAIWGLTTDGADGVAHVINMLRAELAMAMALSERHPFRNSPPTCLIAISPPVTR